MSDDRNNPDAEVISLFMDKAVWLCRESPAKLSGSQIGEWLIYCIKKGSDDASVLKDKREAIKTVLNFFGLLQRKNFENRLIKFIKEFSHQAPLRVRQCSSRIENGTDWGRTYLKSLAETGGRLYSFVNYSRTAELDSASRGSLLLLAWNMGCELRIFANLISEIDSELECDFRDRADALMALRQKADQQTRHYYSERTEYVLRRTAEGGRLADEIKRWIFTPQWINVESLNFRRTETRSAARLLKKLVDEKKINRNDLFEVIATIIGIQILTQDMGFTISKCNTDSDKPAVELERNNIHCRIQKNFDAADNIHDQLINFRMVNNMPTGLQPDIVYKFRRTDDSSRKPVFLLGDAKNYSGGETGKINYPTALYAMMNYLIAFRDALQINPKDIVDLLDCKGDCKKTFYQRIVLFFPSSNEINDNPQPGPTKGSHPVLFVYANASPEESERTALQKFFENALSMLE